MLSFTESLRMINLGDMQSHYAFNYEPGIGLNLSSGVQSLLVDEKVLYFYHSYLAKNGVVALVLNPIVDKRNKISVNRGGYWRRFIGTIPVSEKEKYGDYYTPSPLLLDGMQIPDFTNVWRSHRYPIAFDLIDTIKHIICDDKEDVRVDSSVQLLDRVSFQKELAFLEVQHLSSDDVQIIRRISEFCEKRSYRLILIVPPLPIKTREELRGALETVEIEYKNLSRDWGIRLIDCLADANYACEDLYVNSYLLNRDGAVDFTKYVEKQLDIRQSKAP